MSDRGVIGAALLGMGTVGTGVYKILTNNTQLRKKAGARVEIRKILVRNREKAIEKGADPSVVTTDFQEILDDPSIQIVIEVMGGIEPAFTYIRQALKSGRHVVTANKDLIAEQSEALGNLASECGCELQYEAAVAGGIPIIGALRRSLCGNEITQIMGIVNGTTNYILTGMTRKGVSFEEALKEASDLGYAEADPTADVEGLDAGRKMAILATLAFHTRVTFADVYTEGITRLTAKDIRYADEFGYVIKLIGLARCVQAPGDDPFAYEAVEARVHPMLIPKSHPLAAVSDVFNAVFVHGDAVDDVMFYGRGAGEMPTASAVVGDVLEIAGRLVVGCAAAVNTEETFRSIPVRGIEESENKYFIRLQAADRPGVLSCVAGILGRHGVSIQQMVQKEQSEGTAEIVMTTDTVREKALMAAFEEFKQTEAVRGVPVMIRVI